MALGLKDEHTDLWMGGQSLYDDENVFTAYCIFIDFDVDVDFDFDVDNLARAPAFRP